MKKSLLRHIFSFALTICFLVGVSTGICADAHIHVHDFLGHIYTYISQDESTHTVERNAFYACDCGYGYSKLIETYTEYHGDTELKYTGTHYHFGKTQTHIAVYNVCCVLCGGVTGTYLDRYSCPGNGACIAP